MKIVFYISSMAPAGGIERVLSKHIEFLAPENEIYLITDDNIPSFYALPKSVKHVHLYLNTELSLNNNKLKRILKIVNTFFKNVGLLRKEIKKIQPDCVYTAHPLNLLKVVQSIKNYNKILVTEHASLSAYNFVYKKIAIFLYKKIKLLAVPTTLDSAIYTSYGIENKYLPNPLPFYPQEIAKLENKLALNIGRFTDDKQHLLLLELWAQSSAIKNGWRLKIIGKGENGEAIRDKITKLNLQSSVFIEEPTTEIVKEYLDASLFLFTSRSEGFGLVLAEAMACGVPCIAFNCPSGPRDIINDGLDGYLIDLGDQAKFIEKIDILTANFELRKILGKRAKIAIKKFSSEMISKQLNVLINAHFKDS